MKKTKKKRILLFFTGAAVLLAAGGIMILKNAVQKAETTPAVLQTVEDYYTEEGIISMGTEYQVIAQASGQITQVLAKENTSVRAEDILLIIDSTELEYQKTLAESTLAGYEASLELSQINRLMTTSPQEYLRIVQQTQNACESEYQAAKSVYEADLALYEAGLLSKIQLEADTAAYEAAQSAWQQAQNRYTESNRYLATLREAGIDETTVNIRFYESEEKQLAAQIEAQKTVISQLENQIAKCQIKAERDGILLSLPSEKMSAVQAGTVAAIIKDRNKPKVEADVLTNIAPYIQIGDPVEITLKLRGKEETYTGTVSRVDAYASAGVSSLGLDEYRVHVEAALEDAYELEQRDGYGVEIKFLLYRNEACLTVPSSAVFEADGQDYVYQIQNEQVVKLPVKVEYQTGTVTVIADGLQEGEAVITQADADGIYEGARVKEAGDSGF